MTTNSINQKVEVRLLRPEDDRTNFVSGNLDLDRFFKQYAGQNQFRHHIGTTYVAHDGNRILGFVTVAAAHITIQDIPNTKKLPHYPLPVLRLARLAVDQTAKEIGVGKLLLRAVFDIAHKMAESIGCVGVVVDAKADAVEYYKKYGFQPLEVIQGKIDTRPEPLPMFLCLGSIPKA